MSKGYRLCLCVLATMAMYKPAIADDVSDGTFQCLLNLTKVKHVYVANLLGSVEGTVEAANNPEGGVYPVGSVLQQSPTEAMVKRDAGFNPDTNDWEFFVLDLSPQGATIKQRGGAEVVNAAGDSCAACHMGAAPQWDMTCGNHKDCSPLAIARHDMRMQAVFDPRCDGGRTSKTRNQDMFFLQHRLARELVEDMSKEPQQ